MPAWDVVVVGGSNWDFLARGPSLPGPGGTVSGDDFQEAPGGKGANQALAAARLGAHVAFVSRLGRDARGDAILEALSAEGVDCRFVERDDRGAHTGVALIQVDGHGEKQILTAPGANRRMTVDHVAAARQYVEDASVVLLQLEPPMDVVLAAARLAADAGARVVLDPAPPAPLPEALLRRVHLVRPNADEAAALTGLEVRDRDSARRAARFFLERGPSAAVVQAGDAGDLLVWRTSEREDEPSRTHELLLPRLPVDAVDSTGAGDAFIAALSVMLAEGRELPEAARFASAAAALTTTKLGAQAALPTRAAVDQLFAQHYAAKV